MANSPRNSLRNLAMLLPVNDQPRLLLKRLIMLKIRQTIKT